MIRRATAARALPAAALLLLAVACGGAADEPAATNGTGPPAATGGTSEPAGTTVAVARLAFAPAEVTVPAGTTVTWRSEEPITHTVTSGTPTGVDATTGLRSGEKPDGTFDGPLDTTGATFAHRFDKPGTYAYYCAIHQGMNARVVVT